MKNIKKLSKLVLPLAIFIFAAVALPESASAISWTKNFGETVPEAVLDDCAFGDCLPEPIPPEGSNSSW